MTADDEASSAAGRLVIIGNFDGVHRGHRAVIEQAVLEASERRLLPTVLTFHPHPATVLRGVQRPPLTDLATKLDLLRAIDARLGVEVVPFDRALAELSPADFAREILVERMAARFVVVGENFRFGKAREGDLRRLRNLGKSLGFEARAEKLRGDASGAFSSTRVRRHLADGEVVEAAQVLGRPHTITGVVVHGDERGRTLGFPTANLEQVHQLLPLEGVYAARVRVGRTGERLPGVVNLGSRPTVERPEAVEVHVLDFHGDLYTRELAVEFVNRLRGICRFDGVDQLREQIARDAQEARDCLGEQHLTSQLKPGQDAGGSR